MIVSVTAKNWKNNVHRCYHNFLMVNVPASYYSMQPEICTVPVFFFPKYVCYLKESDKPETIMMSFKGREQGDDSSPSFCSDIKHPIFYRFWVQLITQSNVFLMKALTIMKNCCTPGVEFLFTQSTKDL